MGCGGGSGGGTRVDIWWRRTNSNWVPKTEDSMVYCTNHKERGSTLGAGSRARRGPLKRYRSQVWVAGGGTIFAAKTHSSGNITTIDCSPKSWV